MGVPFCSGHLSLTRAGRKTTSLTTLPDFLLARQLVGSGAIYALAIIIQVPIH